eukprot:7248073-Ditylum_brightwellii.AAC.1
MAHGIHEDLYNYGGAAITSIVDIQGIDQIKNFLRHMCTYSDVSKAFKTTYQLAQHQSSWDLPILEDVTIDLPHLEV